MPEIGRSLSVPQPNPGGSCAMYEIAFRVRFETPTSAGKDGRKLGMG